MEVSQSGFSGCEIFYFIDSESKKIIYLQLIKTIQDDTYTNSTELTF